MVLQEERRLISQHQIVGQIKELSVDCGALQPDIAILEMMLVQEKQYDILSCALICCHEKTCLQSLCF